MNFLDKWNKAKFNVYESEEKTVLKLLTNLSNFIGDLSKGMDNKTDLNGDHKGTWQGLERPTLSDEGMRATVEKINEQDLPILKQQVSSHDVKIKEIPYEEYVREKPLSLEGRKINFDGFQSMSKKTYGTYENATVTSVIANADAPIPKVLGTDTQGLAEYTNRDSVGLYVENNGNGAILTIPTGTTYTTTTATVPLGTDMSLFKVGMILDVGSNINSDWLVGIIKSVEGNVLTMEDGFYQVRTDTTKIKITPQNNSICRVQWNNKAWSINSNLFINEGTQAGANIELGVLCNHSDINDVGGIDIINMRESTHYGVKVRGGNKTFNENYISLGDTVHFSAKGNKNKTNPLLRSEMENGEYFQISADGTHTKNMQNVRVFENDEKNYSIQNIDSVIVANVSNFTITMPKASENLGRIITILSFGGGNTINSQNGDSIFSINNASVPSMSIAKTVGNITTYKFLSGGNNLWYQIN